MSSPERPSTESATQTATSEPSTLAADPAAAEAQPDPLDPRRLSTRVKLARSHANMTKADLARRVGVCLSAAVQWEHPKGTSPTVSNLVLIATATEVAFEWLATGRGPRDLVDTLIAPPGGEEDIELETRLLQATRGMTRERRESVIAFAQAIAEG